LIIMTMITLFSLQLSFPMPSNLPRLYKHNVVSRTSSGPTYYWKLLQTVPTAKHPHKTFERLLYTLSPYTLLRLWFALIIFGARTGRLQFLEHECLH
jgi:hypothetical protein